MSKSRTDNDMNNHTKKTATSTSSTKCTKAITSTSTTTIDNYKDLKEFYRDMHSLCQVGSVFKKAGDQTVALEYYNDVVAQLTAFLQKSVPEWQQAYAALMMAYALSLIAKLNITSILHNTDADQSIINALQFLTRASDTLETYVTTEALNQISLNDIHFTQMTDKLDACLESVRKKIYVLIHNENSLRENLNLTLQSPLTFFHDASACKINDDTDQTPRLDSILNGRTSYLN